MRVRLETPASSCAIALQWHSIGSQPSVYCPSRGRDERVSRWAQWIQQARRGEAPEPIDGYGRRDTSRACRRRFPGFLVGLGWCVLSFASSAVFAASDVSTTRPDPSAAMLACAGDDPAFDDSDFLFPGIAACGSSSFGWNAGTVLRVSLSGDAADDRHQNLGVAAGSSANLGHEQRVGSGPPGRVMRAPGAEDSALDSGSIAGLPAGDDGSAAAASVDDSRGEWRAWSSARRALSSVQQVRRAINDRALTLRVSAELERADALGWRAEGFSFEHVATAGAASGRVAGDPADGGSHAAVVAPESSPSVLIAEVVVAPGDWPSLQGLKVKCWRDRSSPAMSSVLRCDDLSLLTTLVTTDGVRRTPTMGPVALSGRSTVDLRTGDVALRASGRLEGGHEQARFALSLGPDPDSEASLDRERGMETAAGVGRERDGLSLVGSLMSLPGLECTPHAAHDFAVAIEMPGAMIASVVAIEPAARWLDRAIDAQDAAMVSSTLGLTDHAWRDLKWQAGMLSGRACGSSALGLRSADLFVEALSVEHPSGAPAFESLDARISFKSQGPTSTLRGEIFGGVGLVGPWFFEWDASAPWTVAARFSPQALEVTGDLGATSVRYASHDGGGRWTAELVGSALDTLWRDWVVPAVSPGVLADLSLEGTLDLRLTGDGDGLEWATVRGHVTTLSDRRERVSAEDLRVDFSWRVDGEAPVSSWSWGAARLWQLEFGAHQSLWRFAGTRLENVGAIEWPLFDGALRATQFRLDWPGSSAADPNTQAAVARPGLNMLASPPAVTFEGGVRPIDLGVLVPALGGPPLRGAIAGIVPRVTGTPERLAVDGVLEIDVFDGRIFVRDIVIDDLFGRAPRLAWSADFSRLDLALLTGALDVGLIEGRVSGYLRDVELVDGSPVALDFWLSSDERAPGRRRISQRAVNNLADAGGAQAALSRTFLRFFESFGYRRLGVGCRLQGDRCAMRGLSDVANGGFVIVEGSGLPRLDLIGYEREVDWPALVERLRSIPDREMEVR